MRHELSHNHTIVLIRAGANARLAGKARGLIARQREQERRELLSFNYRQMQRRQQSTLDDANDPLGTVPLTREIETGCVRPI
jgi:hypothetical protein